MTKTNAGKVKLTHRRTGKSIFRDRDDAQTIIENKHFKDVYTAEALENDPKELDKVKSGASTDTKGDETTTK